MRYWHCSGRPRRGHRNYPPGLTGRIVGAGRHQLACPSWGQHGVLPLRAEESSRRDVRWTSRRGRCRRFRPAARASTVVNTTSATRATSVSRPIGGHYGAPLKRRSGPARVASGHVFAGSADRRQAGPQLEQPCHCVIADAQQAKPRRCGELLQEVPASAPAPRNTASSFVLVSGGRYRCRTSISARFGQVPHLQSVARAPPARSGRSRPAH